MTELSLNSRGNIIKKVEATGAVTTYDYDVIGRLLEAKDPTGFTKTSYDSLGNKKQVESADSGTTTFSYSALDGTLVGETTPVGHSIVRSLVDPLDRTLRKTITTPADVRVIDYEYDNAAFTNSKGKLTRVIASSKNLKGPEYVYEFAYDRWGRQALSKLIGGKNTYALAREYDPQGSVTRLTYPDGSVLRSQYAANGHLSYLLLDEGTDTKPDDYKTYANYSFFDANGKPGKVLYGNSVQTFYTFDPKNGLLSSIATHGSSSNKLQDFTYSWTNQYNICNIVDNNDRGYTQFFTYDALGATDVRNRKIWGQDVPLSKQRQPGPGRQRHGSGQRVLQLHQPQGHVGHQRLDRHLLSKRQHGDKVPGWHHMGLPLRR